MWKHHIQECNRILVHHPIKKHSTNIKTFIWIQKQWRVKGSEAVALLRDQRISCWSEVGDGGVQDAVLLLGVGGLGKVSLQRRTQASLPTLSVINNVALVFHRLVLKKEEFCLICTIFYSLKKNNRELSRLRKAHLSFLTTWERFLFTVVSSLETSLTIVWICCKGWKLTSSHWHNSAVIVEQQRKNWVKQSRTLVPRFD